MLLQSTNYHHYLHVLPTITHSLLKCLDNVFVNKCNVPLIRVLEEALHQT